MTVLREMKKFRFSLASVFAAVVVVATLVSARGGLAAEAPLQAMWVATFLLSYGRSTQGGWRRIVRVTAAVSVVWSVLVACVYRWCMDRVGGPTEGLGSHGALIALSGSLTACGLACLVEAVRGAWHVWRGIGDAPPGDRGDAPATLGPAGSHCLEGHSSSLLGAHVGDT